MSDYSKKVVYLSYLEQGSKIKGAGFVKVEMTGGKWSADMQVSGMSELEEKRYDIYVIDINGKEYRLGNIFLHKGKGQWKGEGGGGVRQADKPACKEIGQFIIRISETEVIEGKYRESGRGETDAASVKEKERLFSRQEQAGPEYAVQKQPELKQTVQKLDRQRQAGQEDKPLKVAERVSGSKKQNNREMLGGKEKEIKMEEMILDDKWKQLCQMYPVVHPYEDEREYISIQPKDFVVMTGDYQHLANNSFLLHGFYNYRHIVLGQEPGKEGNFYLGVPGVYYEREKMVALMFGFEAFECCGGRAEPGKFGYYLRKVKI